MNEDAWSALWYILSFSFDGNWRDDMAISEFYRAATEELGTDLYDPEGFLYPIFERVIMKGWMTPGRYIDETGIVPMGGDAKSQLADIREYLRTHSPKQSDYRISFEITDAGIAASRRRWEYELWWSAFSGRPVASIADFYQSVLRNGAVNVDRWFTAADVLDWVGDRAMRSGLAALGTVDEDSGDFHPLTGSEDQLVERFKDYLREHPNLKDPGSGLWLRSLGVPDDPQAESLGGAGT
ncbi:hypothetical protein HUN08_17745 [Gordonia sp. X0973]|uniref:hypothetical protein n=1 Tax=Gordonia sp. X0973 TaxID=2742602 RepID=UPI000F5369E4|nr:hypothetical protein [Gordonia sp. X0973]QKT08845.1 hypothetical protein HUN08_17745 [Gordonia sp. X0973]